MNVMHICLMLQFTASAIPHYFLPLCGQPFDIYLPTVHVCALTV